MTITAGVRIGTGKPVCDDIAIINDAVINNDRYHCETHDLRVVGITDGVGGNAGGKEASLFVAEALSKLSFSSSTEDIKAQIERLNHELIEYAAGIPGKNLMATTLTAIITSQDRHYLVHVGNTRLYIAQGSYLKQLTTDQTTYQWLLSHGQVEEAEHCNKNEISACLGGGNAALLQQLEVSQIFDDGLPLVLVFTSDGIHEYLDIDRLEDLVFSGEPDADIIQTAIDEAETNGSTDDKTLVIVRVPDEV